MIACISRPQRRNRGWSPKIPAIAAAKFQPSPASVRRVRMPRIIRLASVSWQATSRCCRPSQIISRAPFQIILRLKGHQNFRVLARACGIGLAGIGNGQGGFTVVAVWRDTIITINQSAVISLFEDPENGFHIIRVQRTIGILIIYQRPILRIYSAQAVLISYQTPAGIIKRRHTITGFDFIFIADT